MWLSGIFFLKTVFHIFHIQSVFTAFYFVENNLICYFKQNLKQLLLSSNVLEHYTHGLYMITYASMWSSALCHIFCFNLKAKEPHFLSRCGNRNLNLVQGLPSVKTCNGLMGVSCLIHHPGLQLFIPFTSFKVRPTSRKMCLSSRQIEHRQVQNMCFCDPLGKCSPVNMPP